MEFWGLEVAPGKSQVNDPGEDTYVHVSQAALGPSKDGKAERVVIRVETGGKNVVLGTLVAGKVDQMTLDLIFERDFKLSHTSTSASVFFCGYKTEREMPGDYSSEEESEEEDEGEDDEAPTAVPLVLENGTTASGKDTPKVIKTLKEAEQAVEAKAKKAEKTGTGLLDLEAEEGSSEESEEGEDDEDSREDMKSDVIMDFGSDDHDEDDDSESEMDEDDLSGEDDDSELDEDYDDGDSDEEDDEEDDDIEVEKKLDAKMMEIGKKRAQISAAQKSPATGKKARVDTPAKPGSKAAAEYWESLIDEGQKGLITTPAKKGAAVAKVSEVKEAKEAVAKTPSKEKEASPKTPKSVGDSAKKLGAHRCVECDRSFATDSALTQHAKAKHKS